MSKTEKLGFHGENSTENLVLYDWLGVTFHNSSPEDVAELLGLNVLQFEVMNGFYGYKSRLYYDGISIHYDGREDMGVNLEMSGQGCRVFETFGHGDWQGLFKLFISDKKAYNITRLDVAYDDHTGVLNLGKIAKSTRKGWYAARAKSWSVDYSNKGTSVYIGSKKSDILIRFYDKAAERKIENKHWVRCELQLRRDRALNFILQQQPIGEVFSGVLNNYLRYVRPTGNDSNVRRWDVERWWFNFVKSVEKISLYTKKDIEYNLSRVEKYIFKQAGNSIDTYIRCVGMDYFLTGLKKRGTYLKQHQQALIKQYEDASGEIFQDEEKDHETPQIRCFNPKPRE